MATLLPGDLIYFADFVVTLLVRVLQRSNYLDPRKFSLQCGLAGWRPGIASVPVQRQSAGEISYSEYGLSFSSIQTFNWLGESHSHYEEQPVLLLIKVLFSSKNTLTETPNSVW